MKVIILGLVMLLTASCSTTGLGLVKSALLGGDKGGLEIDTELIAGNKEELIQTEVQLGGRYQAQVINNKDKIPFTFMLLMVLGWLLPSPAEIWKGIKNILPWMRDK